ncbi:hypothetical protein SLA2020_267580 [Shorea laevis]
MLLKLCFSLFLLINLAAVILAADRFCRDDFPQGFVFGSGSSAYQIEGAADQDGRAPSIWDTFAHDGKMHGDNADVACDEYHRYKEDVQLMVDTGLEAYRFSISWSRLIPNGRGPINPKGLQYYNNLINELISNGIQPHVTLHHSDLPQALEDEYGGWVNRKIVKDFTAYADVCFRKFGDRVSHWTTVNEANVFVIGGYDGGYLPPQHCSSPFGVNCTRGNSSTEPYLAAHHILLAHASASILYKEKYQGWKILAAELGMVMAVFDSSPGKVYGVRSQVHLPTSVGKELEVPLVITMLSSDGGAKGASGLGGNGPILEGFRPSFARRTNFSTAFFS